MVEWFGDAWEAVIAGVVFGFSMSLLGWGHRLLTHIPRMVLGK